jgi:hypothetical protein
MDARVVMEKNSFLFADEELGQGGYVSNFHTVPSWLTKHGTSIRVQ